MEINSIGYYKKDGLKFEQICEATDMGSFMPV